MLFSCYDRAISEGLYICDNHSTIRETAKVFGVSKSCVHKDIHQKLRYANYPLYVLVTKILSNNFSEKHLRGGLATKNKFALLKKEHKK